MVAPSLRRDRQGQAAVVDAILFMTVMLIATAVIIGNAGSGSTTGLQRSGLQQYSRDFSQTVLAIELSGMEYTDVAGQRIFLGDSGKSISQLLCDEAIVLRSGPGQSDFTLYESRLQGAADSIIRPGMGYALYCDGGSVFVSNAVGGISGLPPDRFATQVSVSFDDGNQKAIILTVSLWVA